MLLKKLQHRKISKAKQRLQLKSSKISFGFIVLDKLFSVNQNVRIIAELSEEEADHQESEDIIE